ncbi:MAG: DUF309 domain-containing protein [Chloroflexota bacterium]
MQKPIVVIVGNPAWLSQATEQLEEAYTVHHQPKFDGYMNTLIESLASMVLVDSNDPDWVTWVSTPKASPATRRIPVILVSADEDIRANASVQGADSAITLDELRTNLRQLVDTSARLPDTERLEQLACDCEQALPDLAQQGIAKFNAGEYYKQHDLFEELWMATDAPVRDLYRAILQVGVAYFQIERGNYRGALKMLQRSVQWLVTLPDSCQGVDVAQLREDSFRVRAELERLGEERINDFDKSLLKDVVYQPNH